VLLHLIAATDEDVVQSWRTVRTEIEAYGEGLAGKTEILALSKIDSLPEKDVKKLQKQLQKTTGQPVMLLSSVAQMGTQDVLRQLLSHIEELRSAEEPDVVDPRWQAIR
jgi:GTP-binding protein